MSIRSVPGAILLFFILGIFTALSAVFATGAIYLYGVTSPLFLPLGLLTSLILGTLVFSLGSLVTINNIASGQYQ